MTRDLYHRSWPPTLIGVNNRGDPFSTVPSSGQINSDTVVLGVDFKIGIRNDTTECLCDPPERGGTMDG